MTLPPHTAEKLYHGEDLTEPELRMVARLPNITESLLAHIPRLEPVRAILRSSLRPYRELPSPPEQAESTIQWGGCALKIVLDFDALECKDGNSAVALKIMPGRSGSYDPAILEAFAQLRGCQDKSRILEVSAGDVQLGMVFANDVKTFRGMLLIARGQEVTTSLLERIRNFSAAVGLKEPIRVAAPAPRTEEAHGRLCEGVLRAVSRARELPSSSDYQSKMFILRRQRPKE